MPRSPRAARPRLRTDHVLDAIAGRSPVASSDLAAVPLGGLPEVRPGRRPGGAARRSGGRIAARRGRPVRGPQGRVEGRGPSEAAGRGRAGRASSRAGDAARPRSASRPGRARRGGRGRARTSGVLICRTRHGFVCANAGVDASNAGEPGAVVLLPLDPDASARALRAALREHAGVAPAVIVTDSFGRAWRHRPERGGDRHAPAWRRSTTGAAADDRDGRELRGDMDRRGRRDGRRRRPRAQRQGLRRAGRRRPRPRALRHRPRTAPARPP